MIRSSIIVTLLTLFASGLGFIVQLFLAKNFGLRTEMDAYLFSLSIPTFIAGLVTSIMSYVVIPRVVGCENDLNYQEKYIGSLIVTVVLISTLVAICGILIISKIQIYMLAEDSAIRNYPELSHLVKLCWILAGVQILNGATASVLNALRRHQVAAGLALLPYLGMLAFLIAIEQNLSIVYIALGMLVGMVVSTIISGILLRKKIPKKPWACYQFEEMRQLAMSTPYAAIAMSCFSAYAMIDAFWATQAGEGTLATLGYAQRLLVAFGNLVVVGPIAVLTPSFTKHVINNNKHGFRTTFIKAQVFTASSSVVLAAIFYQFGVDIVKVLFMRGAIGVSEAEQIAVTMQYMLIGLIAMLMSAISIRAIFCWQRLIKQGAIIGVVWSIVYFSASGLLLENGSIGIAISYSIAWGVTLIICLYLIAIESSKLTVIN